MAYTAQQLVNMGFYGYQSWDDASANANFNATGGAGKGSATGSTSGDSGDYVSNLINTLTQQVVPKALEFDTEAARRASEQQWNPYYDELLKDYLTEVSIGRGREGEDLKTYLSGLDIRRGRSKEDLGRSLKTLGSRREEYMGDVERESPLIQEAIGGRAADKGMYFSGGREEQQKLQLEDEGRQKGTYEREYGAEKTRLETGGERNEEDWQRQEEARRLEGKRYLDDLERKKKERERSLAQQREQAVTGQVEQLRYEKYAGY